MIHAQWSGSEGWENKQKSFLNFWLGRAGRSPVGNSINLGERLLEITRNILFSLQCLSQIKQLKYLVS